jgi:Holliday junction resolvasome RuvABC endonuclease subunit
MPPARKRAAVKRTTTKKSLAEFRKGPAEIPEQRRARPTFRPQEWVLGFDQSLASTGWALICTDDEGIPIVMTTGMILTSPTHLKSFADTFLRLEYIEDQMGEVIKKFNPPVVVHEMPALWGKRTDSSLVTCVTLRSVARRLGVPTVMIHNNSMKRVVVGKPNATKAEVKAAVKSFAPTVVNCKPNNEHTNDAIALALTHLRK